MVSGVRKNDAHKDNRPFRIPNKGILCEGPLFGSALLLFYSLGTMALCKPWSWPMVMAHGIM